jgi:peroxiredoxin
MVNMIPSICSFRTSGTRAAAAVALAVSAVLLAPLRPRAAQQHLVVWSAQEKPIAQEIGTLRKLPDDVLATTTRELALKIRALPATPNKLRLANGLANLSTEGDFGRDTLQEVTTTLAGALREQPQPDEKGQPAEPYLELAQLVRYEHMQASLDSSSFAAAMARLAAEDATREDADFTLDDLDGKAWTLRDLRGKVVLVNFWATWCPPCRKEMPDLEALYNRFKGQGFVILGISDEEASKVKPFVENHDVAYPVLLDPGRKVNDLFSVDSIPKTFIYNREGKLAAESIDMRTQKQFLEMLAQAGLQ